MRKSKRESSLLRLSTNVGCIVHRALSRPILGVAILAVVVLLEGCGTSGGLNSGTGRYRVDSRPVPNSAMSTYERALEAMASGDATEAELELEQLILEYPDYAGPYVNLAILYRSSGRVEQAVEVLDRALALEPNHPAANNQLGILLRAQGQFIDAEAAYLRAIAAAPEYSLAYYNLGILVDLYLQRPTDALRNYERYQDLASAPNAWVAGWIIDLRRRLGVTDNTPRVAQEIMP